MNMRKFLAVLVSVLMLCTVIPMGAMSVSAAPGDVIIDADFEDGMDGFYNYSVVDGALVLDGTAADWANSYAYAGAIQPDTTYQVTFRAKADTNMALSFKINNGWNGTNVSASADITTEWAEYELFLTPDSNLVEPIFTIQTGTLATDGTVYYIDYVKVVEYKEPAVPGVIINGDFETGDATGWNCHQGTVISTTAAYNGHYGANIKGDGGWGGMLDQEIAVEAGKTYKVSIWAKANANGANIQIQDGPTGTDTYLASTWFTAAEWTELTWEVTPTTDVICFNFCGGGNGIAEDVYVDDVTVTELKDPSNDGFVINGDFEIGEATPWTLFGNSAVSADAAKNGAYGLICNNPTGNWNGTAYQDFTVEVGKTYKVTMWAKAISQGQNIQIQNPAGGANAAAKWFTTTEWTELTFEFTATADTVRINICGGNTGVEEIVYIDDVKVEEVTAPVNDAVWSVDFNDGDKKFNVGEVVAEGPDGSNCYKWDFAGGWGSNWAGGLSLDATKDYTVTMKVKGSIDSTMAITLMPGSWATWWNGPSFSVTTEWQEVVLAIPAGSTSFNTGIFEFQGTGNEPAYTLYVDDIVITEGLPELPEQSYPINGDFETGKVAPWENLWGSCPTVEIVEGGLDSDYALHIVSSKWNHVRQTAIPVEPNTWYKVTAWAKNTSDMILLVKDGGDSANLNQTGMTAGEEWTEFSGVFYTGDYTTIIISLMGGENDEVADKYGTFDNVTLEVTEEPVCEHEYEFECSTTCKLCGEETRPEAVCVSDSALCVDGLCIYCGNDVLATAEHTYFYACDKYCMECGEETNPDAEHSVLHVEAKAAVSCVEYGNREYWYCEHCGAAWLDANLIRQTNMMSVRIAGECISDAEHPCQDGVCINCGLPCYAEAEHEYDDEYDADCNVCGEVREVPEKPVDTVYGDADGDGEVTVGDASMIQQYLAGYDVELADSADADGDGEVTVGDASLIQQYLAGYEVTLGPV